MIKKLFYISLFQIIALNGFSQKPDPDFSEKMARQEMLGLIKKSAFSEAENNALYDLTYQRMIWEINPEIRYIKGSVLSKFKSSTPELKEIEFDLHENLRVDSVLQNKDKINFRREKNRLILSLKSALAAGSADSVTVFYQGEPPTGGNFGSFEKNAHAGVPVIWTLSEPYGALEWWPCKQSLTDKIDSIDIIVTSPEMHRTASNGIIVSETVNGGKRTMHWRHRYPIATYLVAIAVTNYSSYSDSLKLDDGRIIDILNFVYPENLESAKTQTPVTAELIALFNRLIGEYPFADEKYGHAQFGWGGGMEHQTMSFMYNFGFELVAHELAHQWFGDYITLGTWQDIWLNEGFATYMSGLAYEHLLDGYWWSRWKRLTVDRIVSQPGGSVFVKDTTSIGTIFSSRLSYSKGSYLLHMLRWVLGDGDFFKGMQAYFNDPEIANGFARNAQFVKHMEAAGDTSLTEFFNDWYYGEGFPVYSAQFAPVKNGVVKISLSQLQSHNSVSFFEMPVPARLYSKKRTDSLDVRLNHTTNGQNFLVDVNFNVAELVIDPDLWLISKTSEVVQVPSIPAINEIALYPNPFSDEVLVFVPVTEKIQNIRLYAQSGRLVFSSFGNKRNFDWGHLPHGIYLIRIETDSGSYGKKLVKLQ